MMGWYGGGTDPLGWLAMALFWLAMLALIVWLVGRLLPGSSTRATRLARESAIEILDRRLASGEIDMRTWLAQRGDLLEPADRGLHLAQVRAVHGDQKVKP